MPADIRLVTATTALQEVAALTGGRDLRGAPDLGQVAGHLCAIVCVGAHATAASIRLYLGHTSVAAQQGRAAAQLDATSEVPRFVFTRLLQRVERAEDLTLIGLSQAGRYARPGTPPAPTDQVEGTTARWAQVAGQALTADTPSIADLRTIARVNAQLSTYARHLARASLEVGGALTPFQEVELRPALQAVSQAWARAERDWHPAMDAGNAARTGELTQAGIDVVQVWNTTTHRGPRWATGREIAISHDLGDLLEISAQHHRQASLLARDYTAATGRLLAAGTITVPAKLAQQITGQAGVTRRVPLTDEYLAASGFGAGHVDVAAETARVALDTVLLHSPAATAARARLPLQMAAPDLDAAIRRRGGRGGYQVAVVDGDPQGNLSEIDFGVETDRGRGLAMALQYGTPLATVDGAGGVDIVCGGADLQGALGAASMPGTDISLETNLRAALGQLCADRAYDLVLIDSGPGDTKLLDAYLRASRWLIVPTISDEASLAGLDKMGARFVTAKQAGAEIEFLGAVLTKINHQATARNPAIRGELTEALGDAAEPFEAMIRYSDANSIDARRHGMSAHEVAGEAVSQRKSRLAGLRERARGEHRPSSDNTAWWSNSKNSGSGLAADYEALTREILTRISEREAAYV